MALDGILCYQILHELCEAKDSHIDKIYQPSADELVLLLRKKGFAKRLLMSARAGTSRVHFIEEKYENPQTPPLFCQLARKYFSAARFINIEQIGLDRVLKFTFESTNELGDRVNVYIICELISASPNVIMLHENGKIIDALKRSDIEKNKRIIQPGANYQPPESSNKLNILCDSIEDIVNAVKQRQNDSLSVALLSALDGFSPLVCREISSISYGDDLKVCETENFEILNQTLSVIKDIIQNKSVPTIVKNGEGKPIDFTFLDINQYGKSYSNEHFENFSVLLEKFYSDKQNEQRKARLCADIRKLLNNLIQRATKRQNIRKCDLEKCKTKESLRICGELIKANLYRIKSGDESCLVQNFYDENLSEIKIRLNPAISPQQNASQYFKEYKKQCIAQQTLSKLIEDDESEILYLESVLESLARCEKVSDIAQIKEELTLSGYIKQKGKPNSKKAPNNTFLEYESEEGYKIIVGKNNIQNDYITTRLAQKNDMWFHVKGHAGSHVVVFCGGKELSEDTVNYAATLAAKNSKAKNSSNVAVDYTPIKYVKKPSGAKPGMVVYTTNKTAFVTVKE